MAFIDKVQGLLQKVTPRRENEQQPQLLSNRANGGFSGYQPKIPKRKPVENIVPEHPATGFSGMMPGGVDAGVMQQFQQVGGSTGTVQPQQAMPQQMQGRPMAQPQPHARQAGPVPQRPAQPQQPLQNTGYQPRHQSPAPQMMHNTSWQPAYKPQQVQQNTGWQPVQPPQPVQQQPAQPPVDNGLRYFPGAYVTEEGSVYKMVLRVAQITGVASCYRLIEFMQNSEAMIVNAEQISDVMEADRCMDLLFGAAYAMNQNFVRISGKMIYLITPKQMQVVPFDSLLHMSNEDIDRRWPGSNRGYQENARFGGFAQQHRQDDFAPAYGQRANRSAQAGAYTDYGGFGMRR